MRSASWASFTALANCRGWDDRNQLAALLLQCACQSRRTPASSRRVPLPVESGAADAWPGLTGNMSRMANASAWLAIQSDGGTRRNGESNGHGSHRGDEARTRNERRIVVGVGAMHQGALGVSAASGASCHHANRRSSPRPDGPRIPSRRWPRSTA